MFNEKSNFFVVETAQIEPVLVMLFSPIAVNFNPFPLYPLHAPQAGPQKTLQICAFLLQVASLDDLSHVSDIILMTSSCMRHYVGCIFLFPVICFHDFSDLFHFPDIFSMIKRTATEI